MGPVGYYPGYYGSANSGFDFSLDEPLQMSCTVSGIGISHDLPTLRVLRALWGWSLISKGSSGSFGGRVYASSRVNSQIHFRGFFPYVSTVELPSCLEKWERMFAEKRKFKRFKGKEGAFAAFIRHNTLINTGRIEDISMGGLCVRYFSVKGDKEGCFRNKNIRQQKPFRSREQGSIQNCI